MSLIHEALKRAEQQRQLGEPPTLATPFGVAPRRRSIVPILLPLIGVALLAGWWLLRTPAQAPATIASSGNTSPPIATPGAPGDQRAAPASTVKVPANSVAADRKPSAPRGLESAPGQGAEAGPRGFASVPPRPTIKEIAERESEPRPAGANPLAPGEAAPQALTAQAAPDAVINDPADVAVKSASKRVQGEMPVVPSPASTTNALPEPAAATTKSGNVANVTKDTKAAAPAKPVAPPVAAAIPPAAVAPPPVATAPAPAAAPQEAVPMLWQLPLSVRKDLPELKLTMHVYSAEPAQRFVVLNGNRQVEGDELGADVKLHEIRVDGAVLEFHGQRFMVPRGGS